jgi:transposase
MIETAVMSRSPSAGGDSSHRADLGRLLCSVRPRQGLTGGHPASHGRITKAGPGHARGMLVEAAWAASRTPGPLHAFYQRVRARLRRRAQRGT